MMQLLVDVLGLFMHCGLRRLEIHAMCTFLEHPIQAESTCIDTTFTALSCLQERREDELESISGKLAV